MQEGQDDSCPAAPEISYPLCVSRIRYRVRKNPLMDPSLNQTNPVHIMSSCFFKIHLILASHPIVNSSVCIGTRYGLDGPGIESRWGRDFPHPPRPAVGPTQPPIQWVSGHRGSRDVQVPTQEDLYCHMSSFVGICCRKYGYLTALIIAEIINASNSLFLKEESVTRLVKRTSFFLLHRIHHYRVWSASQWIVVWATLNQSTH